MDLVRPGFEHNRPLAYCLSTEMAAVRRALTSGPRFRGPAVRSPPPSAPSRMCSMYIKHIDRIAAVASQTHTQIVSLVVS